MSEFITRGTATNRFSFKFKAWRSEVVDVRSSKSPSRVLKVCMPERLTCCCPARVDSKRCRARFGSQACTLASFGMYIARMQVSPNIKECRAAQLGALVRALGVPLPTLMLPIRGGLSWSTPRPEWGQANALNASVGLKASCAQKAKMRSAKGGPQHKV